MPWLFTLLVLLQGLFYCNFAQAQLVDNQGGFCKSFQLTDIPVSYYGDGLSMPISEMRVTQNYHNPLSDGWCSVGSSQYAVSSGNCDGQKIYYGHDGLDLHPQGARAGEQDIYAPQAGLVVASQWKFERPAWGDSIILASRPNAYSEEILTFHFHHLHSEGKEKSEYSPTRLVNPCDTVTAGQILAKEGGTSNWPTHLHLSLKRWNNLQELLNQINNFPNEFYGYGYTFGNDNLLQHFLDPKGYFFDYFGEFQDHQFDYPDWQWSYQYAHFLRQRGWEFGLYDGDFGVTKAVTKREISRWLKIALEMPSVYSGEVPFQDVSAADYDYVYLATLLSRNHSIPIINNQGTCQAGGIYFCPNAAINRAEALKMIISGFFQNQFLEIYNNWIWKVSGPVATQLLSKFVDIEPASWYAPYVYFGTLHGLVQLGDHFRPSDPITRGELAKWLTLSYLDIHGSNNSYCAGLNCQEGYYCDEINQGCRKIPECLPSESNHCPLGGGYTNNADAGAPDGNGQILDSGTANSGEAGQNQDAGVDSGFLNDAGIDSGFPDQFGGNITPSCTDHYYLTTENLCFDNPAGSGSPTICLELNQINGPSWNYRFCKQGGAFINQVLYDLIDLNHLNHFLDQSNLAVNSVCSSWKNLDFSYLGGDGLQNGAYLKIQLHSPANCSQPGCIYNTGLGAIFKHCF